ncbi:Uncharacterised protein [Streptococcus pneumoniae]|nr:Uncharacterised protein [Streptococcus pneumoniae]
MGYAFYLQVHIVDTDGILVNYLLYTTKKIEILIIIY